jgi:hypothetical protein
MMETESIPETSVNLYQTTLRNNAEDSHLQTHRRENLKSKTSSSVNIPGANANLDTGHSD